MRLKQIQYHLERAAHFRRLAELEAPPGPGYLKPEKAAERAEHHSERAAELFAAGLAEYAARSESRGARDQRRRRRRLAIDPRTDPAVAGRGRGRRKADGWVSLGRGKGFKRSE